MAKFERGVYEPSEDSRVFDGGEDEEMDEGSRAPLLIVIALIVVAAFAAFVYVAYQQGVKQGRESAPRIITADRGPLRVPPPASDSSGTTSSPLKDLKIYQQPAPPDDEIGESDSVPQPPTELKKEPEAKAAVEPKPAPVVIKPAETKPAETKPAPVQKEVAQKPAEKPQEKPVQTAITKPAPTTTSSTVAGAAYTLQIGAYKSEAEALSAWKSYERRHPAVGGYEPDVKMVDLGDKGVWYRLRMGAFASKDAADTLCNKLKADGGGCFPAKP